MVKLLLPPYDANLDGPDYRCRTLPLIASICQRGATVALLQPLASPVPPG